MEIRTETQADAEAIAALIDAAFAGAVHSDGSEATIVERLRNDGGLALSLVAVERLRVIGHIALSPVTIDGNDLGWMGLGPLAVVPDQQKSGIGGALVEAALHEARITGAAGCVVLGDPAYYGRFGFLTHAGLSYPGAPAEYFQAQSFSGTIPSGIVAYHPAFG